MTAKMASSSYVNKSRITKNVHKNVMRNIRNSVMEIKEKEKEKREAWKLFPACGHLVLAAEPTSEFLSPVHRTLEVLLDGGDEVCACCNDTCTSPLTLRGQLAIGIALRKDEFDVFSNESLSDRARVAAVHNVVHQSLDNSYIEGIIDGAMAKPLYSLIYENHFQNEYGSWSARKSEMARTSKMATEMELRPSHMEELDYLLRKTQDERDCAFSFVQGKLVGQRWAELQGRAMTSAELGPDLPPELQMSDLDRRCTVLPVSPRRFRKGSSKEQQKMQHLIEMVLLAKRVRAEDDQVPLPAPAVLEPQKFRVKDMLPWDNEMLEAVKV
ncbi:hypothetical protein VTL71DRAFT_14559 [Oculimacula yallundae]|uniref:Uncharacterized protein n=1 Tax=Oculimacula yallundae TaxID=86028 RepID=A0ABR4CJF0_9HELO